MADRIDGNGAALGSLGILYPLLLVAVVAGPAYYFGLLEKMGIGGPKTEQTKVWMVTYVGDNIASVSGPIDTDLAKCRIRASAQAELRQGDVANDQATARHDCIQSSLRPSVTYSPNS